MRFASVPREVIFVTGHRTVHAAAEGLNEGAYEYLVKPPDTDELIPTIGKAYRPLKERCEGER